MRLPDDFWETPPANAVNWRPAMEGLAIGRIVRFVTVDEASGASYERAAIVTKVWTEDGLVNLSVFNDGTVDGLEKPPVVYKTSVPYGEDRRHYSWHWPEKA